MLETLFSIFFVLEIEERGIEDVWFQQGGVALHDSKMQRTYSRKRRIDK